MSSGATLKPLGEQVVVITGASSGIGRETALLLAGKGAGVVLAARNEEALGEVAREVRARGGRALVVVTDVSIRAQVEHLAQEAVRQFGRIDTWVNDAAVSAYALIEHQSVEEIERIMEVNYFGTVYGVKAALSVLKYQPGGGTIINVGSVLSERSIPLQGAYCASKHAVKGFTEALRMELMREKVPVNLTLVLPAVVNTPFYRTAPSHMGVRPQPIPPLYDPSVVAEAIAFACENPRRHLYAGSFGKGLSLIEHISPLFADWMMTAGGSFFKGQLNDDEPDDGRSALYAPIPGKGSTSGGYGQSLPDPYTRYLELHPNRRRAVAVLAIGALALLIVQKRAGGTRKG